MVATVRLGGARAEALLRPGPLRRGIAALTAPLWRPARPLPPHRAPVVTVGGTTLGGAGKTPFVRALAAALASEGPLAVLVHGYRSGDDGAHLAAALAPLSNATVLVGDRRDTFARLPPEVPAVVDGPIARPRPGLGLLLHDGTAAVSPFVPPAGPLRAPYARLAAAADVVLCLGEPPAPLAAAAPVLPLAARVAVRGAAGAPPPGPVLVFTAMARPERVLAALPPLGYAPVGHLALPDHGLTPLGAPPPSALLRAVRELHARFPAAPWVVPAKCLLHLPGGVRALLDARGLAVLTHEIVIPEALLSHLRRLLFGDLRYGAGTPASFGRIFGDRP